jgi:ribulose-phosphate 3-epimerase
MTQNSSQKPIVIAPSILSADFSRLGDDIRAVDKAGADWIHVDVMDGRFVPNITIGPLIVEAIRPVTTKPLDVHLMIVQPERYILDFKAVGADILTVHAEACTHLHRTIQAIKALGMKAGVAINPHTSIQLLSDIIADIDLVCIMSVNPGFGGQKFIENTYRKIIGLQEIIRATKSNALIEIDGGVDMNNYKKLIETGANVLVAGNTVFSSSNPTQTIADLKHL